MTLELAVEPLGRHARKRTDRQDRPSELRLLARFVGLDGAVKGRNRPHRFAIEHRRQIAIGDFRTAARALHERGLISRASCRRPAACDERCTEDHQKGSSVRGKIWLSLFSVWL